MAAVYPGSIKTFTTKVTNDVIEAGFFNDPQDEITAIETGLKSGLGHDLLPLSDNLYNLGSLSRRWLVNGVPFPFGVTAFTPVWEATVTPPGLGNGTLSGYYTRIGNLVYVQITHTIGSTTTFGSGQWFYSNLPVSAIANCVAQTRITDVSHGIISGQGVMSGTTFIPETDGGLVPYLTGVTATTPITWVAGDSMTSVFVYAG